MDCVSAWGCVNGVRVPEGVRVIRGQGYKGKDMCEGMCEGVCKDVCEFLRVCMCF